MKPIVQHIVSIVMPMHNAEATIASAIESVLAQTYDGWQLIIVDDRSTDRSLAIARSYAEHDSRIEVFASDTHTGYPATPRNYGLQMARGRFIAFLDSDDLWLPHKLEHQLPLFDQPQVAVVFSDYEKTNDGTRTGRRVSAPRTIGYTQLLKTNHIGNLTGIYDTQKVGKVTIKTVRHEDYAMWLSILKKGFVAENTQTVEALYRISENSVSSRKLQLLTWQWAIYRQVEGLNIFKASYYYLHYALHAFTKNLI